MQLDRLQKSGHRDKASLDKLAILVNEVPRETQDLINSGILEMLNAPGAHEVAELQKGIASALQTAPSDQYTPEVFVFALSSSSLPAYLIAYNIPYCATCGHAWIGVFGPKEHRYVALSEDTSSFDNKSLHVVLPQKGVAPNLFVVYGTNWGDAHNRLTVAVYRFTGHVINKIWTRTDLPQGNIKLSNQEISLTFLTRLEPPPVAERTETYEIQDSRVLLTKQSEKSVE